jgi:hypothetical protein
MKPVPPKTVNRRLRIVPPRSRTSATIALDSEPRPVPVRAVDIR